MLDVFDFALQLYALNFAAVQVFRSGVNSFQIDLVFRVDLASQSFSFRDFGVDGVAVELWSCCFYCIYLVLEFDDSGF